MLLFLLRIVSVGGDFVLIGKNTKGELVNLLVYSREAIEELRQQQKFVCPACGSVLIIKNGKVMKAHFAHKNKKGCESFSEGETQEHLEGKALIAKWCEEEGVAYQLEAYLSELQQRPDVLIEGNIAIEFQCSPISFERFQERTQNYHAHGYQVIWLLGKNYFLTDQLTNSYQKFLCQEKRLGWYAFELDVYQEKIRVVYHIEKELLTSELYYTSEFLSPSNVGFKEGVLGYKNRKIYHVRRFDAREIYERQQLYLQRNLIAKQPKLLALQKWLYQEGLTIQHVHPIYLLPGIRTELEVAEELPLRFLIGKKLNQEGKLTMDKLTPWLHQSLKEREYVIDEAAIFKMGITWLSFLEKLKFVENINGVYHLTTSLPGTIWEEERVAFFEKNVENMVFISRLPLKI